MKCPFHFSKSVNWSIIVIAALFLPACTTRSLFAPQSLHEQYAASLKKAGLDQTVLGRQWLAAAAKSLNAPLTITLPYQEKGFFPPDKAMASGYRFTLPRGQKVEITITKKPTDNALLFAALWRETAGNPPKFLAAADSSGHLSYEANEATTLILRLQPELLAAVSYDLTIVPGPSLSFPVKGGSNNDIGSRWHDPRDAGARKHEGIDIFAERGTPALAAADGIVTSVRTGGLGGKTVFMSPSGKNFSLYYAHLDTQWVAPGQRVKLGDTLGLVGNTGNARTTPPHLHFGIYTSGGAINPLPFVQQKENKLPVLKGREALLGKNVRTASTQQLLTATSGKEKSKELPRATFATITAAAGSYYKVVLPDGAEGFLPAATIATLDRPINKTSKTGEQELLFAPQPGSATVSVRSGARLPVKAYFGDYAYVETDSVKGWVRRQEK